MPWMSEMIDLHKEKNFFETRVIEYQNGGALQWEWINLNCNNFKNKYAKRAWSRFMVSATAVILGGSSLKRSRINSQRTPVVCFRFVPSLCLRIFLITIGSLALQAHQIVPSCQCLRILLITIGCLPVGHLSEFTPIPIVLTLVRVLIRVRCVK